MRFDVLGDLLVGRFAGFEDFPHLRCWVSTRQGGVSTAPYDSLNLGRATADDERSVRENKRRLLGALGVSEERVVVPAQVHEGKVAVVTEPGYYPRTDALITDAAHLYLAITIADCIPLFLYDPQLKAVGVVHAGWRGTLIGIARRAVELMQRVMGCRPEGIRAAIGPSIEAACYPVDRDVAQKFDGRFVLTDEDGGPRSLDLWAANEAQLIEAGLSPSNIMNPRLCTSCRTDIFFSHRASGGKTGRMLGIIGVRSDTPPVVGVARST